MLVNNAKYIFLYNLSLFELSLALSITSKNQEEENITDL